MPHFNFSPLARATSAFFFNSPFRLLQNVLKVVVKLPFALYETDIRIRNRYQNTNPRSPLAPRSPGLKAFLKDHFHVVYSIILPFVIFTLLQCFSFFGNPPFPQDVSVGPARLCLGSIFVSCEGLGLAQALLVLAQRNG